MAEQGIVAQDRAEAFAIMDAADTAAMLDPRNAAGLIANLRPEALIYEVPTKDGMIVGVSAAGSQILAGRLGCYETLPDYSIENTELDVEVKDGPGGGTRFEVVSGVRATVRVKDNRSGVVLIGVDEEPKWVLLKSGGKRPNSKAVVIAVNKAERNALLKHFAVIEETVKQFAREAKRKGLAYTPGEVAPAAKPVARARVVEEPQVPQEEIAPPAEVKRLADKAKDLSVPMSAVREWCSQHGFSAQTIPAVMVPSLEKYIEGFNAPPPDAEPADDPDEPARTWPPDYGEAPQTNGGAEPNLLDGV